MKLIFLNLYARKFWLNNNSGTNIKGEKRDDLHIHRE